MVFEIVSPSNTVEEIQKKTQFYIQYGVLEVFFYNPDTLDFWGLVRQAPQDPPILLLSLNLPWESPMLGIRFVMGSEGLAVFYSDGVRFGDPQIGLAQRDRAMQERDRAWEKLKELGIDPSQL